MRVDDGNGNNFGKETAEYSYEKNFYVTKVFSKDGQQVSSDTAAIYFHPADTLSSQRFQYNDHNDVVSHIDRNPDGTETLFENEYIYDRAGNCIDEKIYKVTLKPNGSKKRKLDRHFAKEITYSQQ